MARSDPPTPDAAESPPSPRRAGARRPLQRFLTDPSSTRNAVYLIVAANLTVVVVGGLIVWLLDGKEFTSPGEAFWYTLQTITTVGYGDVTPTNQIGRLVGAAVMLLGIASLSILTATITSSFIDARQAERQADETAAELATRRSLEARLEEVLERLDRIERLTRSANGGASIS